MLANSFKTPWLLNYSKDSRKTDLKNYDQIGYLKSLWQIPQKYNLDEDCSMAISKDCTMVWVIVTHHIPISKKIWNLQ
jgi:hypothetical protein